MTTLWAFVDANTSAAPAKPEAASSTSEGATRRAVNDGLLLWRLPHLAFLLLIACVGILLWYWERHEHETQRASLISDMLWFEQNLQFQLRHNEELLAQLPSIGGKPDSLAFASHAKSLLANDSGLIRVLWLSPEGQRLATYPPPLGEGVRPLAMAKFIEDAFKLAMTASRPIYAPPWQAEDHAWQLAVLVPLYDDKRNIGVAVGVYALSRLLDQMAPWWLAERYHLSIIDANGAVLAQRSKIEIDAFGDPYQMTLDLPGQALSIRALPFRQPPPLASRLIVASLIILAVLVIVSFWALRRDVAKRLAAESALKNEVAFRKAMEDSVHTGLRARTLDGRITYVNPAFCRMVGFTAEELIGRSPPMPYWAEEYLDETRAMHARVLAGDAPSEGFEIKLKRKNGEIFDALIHEAPLIDSQGRHVGWMGSVVDITEHKRAAELARQQEERLQASARLIAMGEMASSLAHELNQPLAAISSYLAGCRHLLAHRQVEQQAIDDALAKCMAQAQRAAAVIRRIYAFARRHEPHTEPCDVKAIIGDLASLLEAEARRQGMRIQIELPDRLPLLEADPVLLSQAIFNLMKNGLEAMREAPSSRAILTVSVSVERDRLQIVVADRGCGVPPEIAERLFEPFFTTKSEGLGVGLNICRSVVEAHHGRLWYEPDAAGGSRFLISLPLFSSPPLP
ncbi:MAG: PAS domain S-box protein [Rhodocyclaceae bacterium]|nr:PAS domain S-box protein [Rhodocyclaceae bacterium]